MQGKELTALKEKRQEENDGREWIFLLLLLPVHMVFTEGKKDLKESGFVRPSERQL